MSFARLLQCNAHLADEVGLALRSLHLLDVGRNTRARAKILAQVGMLPDAPAYIITWGRLAEALARTLNEYGIPAGQLEEEALLNLVQTMPSIALFALLIGPLSALAAALPGWGLSGIGLLPAAVALTLYALLPIVHGMSSGLRQVPAAVLAAAAGMGMTPRQRLWRVELPLALPV